MFASRKAAASFAALALLALPLAACGSDEDNKADKPAESTTLTVFAAASLTESFGTIEKDFEAANPGVDVAYSFAGSQTLVEQLSNGAPADVLATANTKTMDKALEGKLVASPVDFVSNTLVLIVPKGNPAHVTGVDASLAQAKLVTCAPEVPCGSATKKLQELLGVTLNPVSEEQAVTDVRGKVASGEADAGIVYRTDGLAEGDDVEIVEIARAGEIVNTYPIAVTASSKNAEAAKKFVDYVRSAKGMKVLTDAGFNEVSTGAYSGKSK